MPGALDQPSYSYGKYTQQVNASKGDSFSHDNKACYRRDGKTILLTGDAMGDVELDADQSAKLHKDMDDKAAREKDATIVPDHIPGGELDRKAPEPDIRQHIQGYSTAEDLTKQGGW